MNTAQLLKQLAAAVRAAGSQTNFAKAHGFSAAYLSDVLAGRREPGPAILTALGLARKTVYRQATHPETP